MSKLLRFYGDTMFAIGAWFMKRGERHATWIKFVPDSVRIPNKNLDIVYPKNSCSCAECD